uniref:Uncharacterized protein n=1 Tax=Arundo donax TaxID=35708 RepID=A0A0A9T1J6_ARUDO
MNFIQMPANHSNYAIVFTRTVGPIFQLRLCTSCSQLAI